MKTRNDAQVYYTEDIPITALDEYIDKKAQNKKTGYFLIILEKEVKSV